MNHRHLQHRINDELEFACKIRQALDHSTESLSEPRTTRLAAARQAALKVQKINLQPATKLVGKSILATSNQTINDGFSWAKTAFLLALLVIVALCVANIYSTQQQRRIEELADIDTAMLLDEVPISLYADHAFNAFIKRDE